MMEVGQLRGMNAAAKNAVVLGTLNCCSRRLYPQGNGTPEGRAFAHLTLDPDLAAMLLDDEPTDVEAKPQTGITPTLWLDIRRLIEAFPDPRLNVGRQSWPLVAHRDARHAFPHAHVHPDLPGTGGILAGVIQIVGEHLRNAHRIGLNIDLARPLNMQAQ